MLDKTVASRLNCEMRHHVLGVAFLLPLSGCGLVLSPDYSDAGMDAARMNTPDADLDTAAATDDAQSPPVDDAAAPDAWGVDVGVDGGIRHVPVCGDGLVEGEETCDVGPAPIPAVAALCLGCASVLPMVCRNNAREPFPAGLATERGEGTLSAWTWSIDGTTWLPATTTDEATCVLEGSVGYLHGPNGLPGQDGWISPAMGGCGLAPGATNTTPVRFRRTFRGTGMPFQIAIGIDNVLEPSGGMTGLPQVHLDGTSIPAQPVSSIRTGPEYAVRWLVTLPAVDPGLHTLEVRVLELNGSPTNNNTGLYLNAWAPTECIVSGG